MILYYGVKNTPLITEQSTKVCICPECGNDDNMINTLFARYFHIYGIPLFSLGKIIRSQCQFCYQSFAYRKIPNELKDDYNNLKIKSRIPIWQFSGLLLVALLITLISINSKKENDKVIAMIANPMENDIYIVRTPSKKYTTFKVVGMMKDSIVFRRNEFEINNSSAIKEIEKKNYYSKSHYVLTKKEVIKLHEIGEIYKIIRTEKSAKY